MRAIAMDGEGEQVRLVVDEAASRPKLQPPQP